MIQLKIQPELYIGLAAIIISLGGLFWSIIQRTRLDREKFAIDMIKDWNNNTLENTSLIRIHYPKNYDDCEPISQEEAKKIIDTSIFSDIKEREEYLKIKDSIYSLLNYFEFISAAYNKGTVDREIIRNSFSLTMLRYFIVLKHIMILEFITSKRNHWKPFTNHLEKLIEKNELKCTSCGNKDCIINKTSSENKLLDYLNSDKINKKLFKDLQKDFKIKDENTIANTKYK